MAGERVAPSLPEGRRAVIYALRRRGQATADDIARQLDMTVSGARQHLTALVEDGFAEATELPRPKGQRSRSWFQKFATYLPSRTKSNPRLAGIPFREGRSFAGLWILSTSTKVSIFLWNNSPPRLVSPRERFVMRFSNTLA